MRTELHYPIDAIVAIAGPKEHDYIKEWLDWHINLGFDCVFLYENNTSFTNEELGPNADKVQHLTANGNRMQIPAYYHFLKNYAKYPAFRSATIIDIDEFIHFPDACPKHNVKEFMENNSFPVITFNWRLFGDSNLKYDPSNKSVLKRFTHAQNKLNQHVKTMLNLEYIRKSIDPTTLILGDPHSLASAAVNTPSSWNATSGTWHRGPFCTASVDKYSWQSNPCNQPYIAHYFTKTLDEYIERRSQPRADSGTMRDKSEFYAHNFNDVEETQLANR